MIYSANRLIKGNMDDQIEGKNGHVQHVQAMIDRLEAMKERMTDQEYKEMLEELQHIDRIHRNVPQGVGVDKVHEVFFTYVKPQDIVDVTTKNVLGVILASFGIAGAVVTLSVFLGGVVQKWRGN